ncbi:(d)CMP kinase [Streptomyces sp. NBC_01716]|uniref:(d)CMP kinase n=1 Tax=Streptomyces sp. NBC_01716 TaxID=2975917 RepID=UPI002E36CC12|nr:(d)CMP kinase [Streptomyces sp. NBC_01716]
MPHITISIDGPTASGKTTLATSLAKYLGLTFLDTGLTFRSLAYAIAHEPTKARRIQLGANLKHLPAVYDASGMLTQSHAIFLDEKEITEDIWDPSLDEDLKRISKEPALRQEILRMHHSIVEECGNVVVVGRDVGVTLLPTASLQIYLTASLAVRRERRRAQYRERSDRSTAVGPPTERDEENRVAVWALRNSIEIQSTYLPASAVFACALNRLNQHSAHITGRHDET